MFTFKLRLHLQTKQLFLNASEKVNNLTVMTNVSTAHAPAGKVLMSCNGILDFEDQELAEKSKRN
jgi:hypothetical protein